MSTDTNIAEFEALLPAGLESRAQMDTRLTLIGEYRKRSRDASATLDRVMCDRIRRQSAELREVQSIVEELRKVIDEVLAPPWYPATFIRAVETAVGPLAEVVHGGGWRLVHAGEGVDLSSLPAGQRVFLGHDRNSILGVDDGGSPEVGDTAIVEEILHDGRLMLRDRDALVLARAMERLHCDELEPGDTVRWDREPRLAFERVRAGAPTQLLLSELLSAQAHHSLGGLEAQTTQVIELFTQAVAHPEMAASYGLDHASTLLLHGPPGNGKTSLARIVGSALAAATGQQCRFASVKGAELERPYVGQTAQCIRALFRELGRGPGPALLYIDEVDAMGRTRGAIGDHHSDKFLGTWLAEIEGFDRRRPIAIIASTNRKDLIDQALLERLSGMDLYIGRPGLSAAREIFAIHLPAEVPLAPNGSAAERTREEIVETAVAALFAPNADNSVAELRFRDGTSRSVAAREILSGRTIAQICTHARRNAFSRQARGGEPGVRVEDMEDAVAHGIERLASTLSVANAHALLDDLPRDRDVVAVEPVRRKVARHRYRLREQAHVNG